MKGVMYMTKVAVFVGSLRENSTNKSLARALEKLAPEGMKFEYIDINLPLYSEDVESANFPESAQRVKDIVEASDGVLFASPEYSRAVPGALKNAIDWASRPYGKNSFAGKPVAVVGSSVTPIGTALAQTDIRRIMAFSNAKTMGQPELHVGNAMEVFDERGEVISDRWLKNFQQFINSFDAWIAENK